MSWLSKIFNRSGEKRDTTYQGPKPVSTLTNTPGYKEAYPELVNRLAGKGVGYSSSYTKAPIEASRNQFEGYSVPELKSSISAMGLSGSPGAKHLTQAYQGQNAYESDLQTNLMREAEQQKRTEINNALTGLGQFGGAEAGQSNLSANFEYNDHNRLLGEEAVRRQSKDEYSKWALQQGMLAGSGIAGGMAPTPAPTMGTPSYLQPQNYRLSGGYPTQDLRARLGHTKTV